MMEYTRRPWIDNGNEIVSAHNPKVGIGGFIKDGDNKLAAASPDMYEAIQELIAQMPGLWGDRIFNGMIRLDVSASTIDKLMDAMSKAEGK